MTRKVDDKSTLQCPGKWNFNWRSSLISSFISLDLFDFPYVIFDIANSFIVDLLWLNLIQHFALSLFHHCVSLPNFFLFVIVISCRLIVLICLFCSRRHSLIWSHLVSTLHGWWLFWLSLVPLFVWTYIVNLISYWIQDIVV